MACMLRIGKQGGSVNAFSPRMKKARHTGLFFAVYSGFITILRHLMVPPGSFP
jgi:hypothetical protein